MSTTRKIPINGYGPAGERPLSQAAGPERDVRSGAPGAAQGAGEAAFADDDPRGRAAGAAGSAAPGPDRADAAEAGPTASAHKRSAPKQASASESGGRPSSAGGPGSAKAPADAGVSDDDAQSAAAAKVDKPGASEDSEALVAEREALNDALLRLRAEFENYRRRSIRELAESRERAQAELLHDLLPVLDNLERALDAAEHHEENKVLGGVRMTKDMFVDLLKRVGVEEIETEGVPFDPEVHDAIAVQPSQFDDGLVSAVVQRGYRQGDRVLRPARVVVSSGPGASGDGVTAG